MLIVVLFRLLLSTAILKYPLFGGLCAVILDYHDMRILQYFQSGDLSNYQFLDKLLDLFYLSLEAYVAYNWKNLFARKVAIILFLYRLAGIAIFEITHVEAILVFFPNVFEYFYLVYLLSLKVVKKEFFFKPAALIVTVVILTLAKIPHEYLLHINTTQPWAQNVYVQMIFNPDFVQNTAAKAIEKIQP
jgi:hypothetical protein